MKTTHAIALSDHIRDNRESFVNRQGSLSDSAAAVSEQVGFKVTPGQLSDVLKANGIETRRMSERDRERRALLADNERLQAENQKLRQIVAKVRASEYLPEDLKDYILATLPQEMLDALACS